MSGTNRDVVVQAARLHGSSVATRNPMSQREIITKRCLPHWYVPGAAHFVTYRLFGSLPRKILEELRIKKDVLLKQKPEATSPGQHRPRVHKQLFGDYDAALDRAVAIRHLADPRVAALVRSNLYHHHNSKYHLLAYSIMSNHVHVLFVPRPEEQAAQQVRESVESCVGEQSDEASPLSTIMHSLKSYTAHEANKILRRTGTFWHTESYDHWIRDDDELERVVEYICANPVRAGLVEQPHDWYF